VLAGPATRYEKALDYASKKYEKGLKNMAPQAHALPSQIGTLPRPFSLFPVKLRPLLRQGLPSIIFGGSESASTMEPVERRDDSGMRLQREVGQCLAFREAARQCRISSLEAGPGSCKCYSLKRKSLFV